MNKWILELRLLETEDSVSREAKDQALRNSNIEWLEKDELAKESGKEQPER
jgi:hypothetical protein